MKQEFRLPRSKRITSETEPVFKIATGERVYYYTPGYLVWTDTGRAADFEQALSSDSTHPLVQGLFASAQSAQAQWNRFLNRSVPPVCLTIYPNEQCNLNCVYCFARPSVGSSPGAAVSMQAAQAAVRLVARNCKAENLPLTLVFHGGGEPTLSFLFLKELVAYAQQVSRVMGIGLFTYIATNGTVNRQKLDWLIENIDLIGLSCDGPPAIQAANRGKLSVAAVERVAKTLRERGKKFHVRTTLTPAQISSMPEIARYLCQALQPELIHIEPVYSGGKSTGQFAFQAEDSASFVRGFMEAKQIARQHRCGWMLSGSRLEEVHGAYCNPFRRVLNLIPGDVSTACFKLCSHADAITNQMVTGYYDASKDEYRYDEAGIRHFQQHYVVPPGCLDCFLMLQCTHQCPSGCPAQSESQDPLFCPTLQLLAIQTFDRMASGEGQTHVGVASGRPLPIKKVSA